MNTLPISVLLLTLNEQDNLPGCLAGLSWCEDIVVLDSFSGDDTVLLAEQAGCRVYQRQFDHFAGQRNWALDNVAFKHHWVLHLDADERVPAALLEEMVGQLGRQDVDGFLLPSKMMFFDQWLQYSGLYPSYQARLGRQGAFRFKQVGHGQREDVPAERMGQLAEPYLHYCFSKGMSEWLAKHNRYASDEAAVALAQIEHGEFDGPGLLDLRDGIRRRRAIKQLVARVPARPLLRFLYMYVLRRGFLDGRMGLRYCTMVAVYEWMIVLKMKEARWLQQGKSV